MLRAMMSQPYGTGSFTPINQLLCARVCCDCPATVTRTRHGWFPTLMTILTMTILMTMTILTIIILIISLMTIIILITLIILLNFTIPRSSSRPPCRCASASATAPTYTQFSASRGRRRRKRSSARIIRRRCNGYVDGAVRSLCAFSRSDARVDERVGTHAAGDCWLARSCLHHAGEQ